MKPVTIAQEQPKHIPNEKTLKKKKNKLLVL